MLKLSIEQRRKMFAKLMKYEEEKEAKAEAKAKMEKDARMNRVAFAELPLSERDVVMAAQGRIEARDDVVPSAAYYAALTKEQRAEMYNDLLLTSEPEL
ncbi:hypothetical protein OCU04_009552 [Sclerotinia nivalis]|uniref:Uncharacterized protein n=1 Tax=Sclerotinia nivalis TaxID=352851 RepID=A0A9X0AFA4_9HELO|nr:hypothetical protein OCU04_009552 [Sclerotinia nivalis]